jgi:8-amino-7-oxononanoate synthase
VLDLLPDIQRFHSRFIAAILPSQTDKADARMRSLDEFATAKLGELEGRSLRRALVDTTRVTGIWLLREGRRLLSFSCNDYLNLAHHPAVQNAAIEALRIYGVGAGASRLVTGNHPLLGELEARLARLKGTEASCVFGSGYLANLGIIPAVVGARDLILIDELAHACLWAGARLSLATTVPFRHADVAHVAALLAELRGRYQRVLIATDGVFSMDGDIAPLQGLAALAQRHDAWLMSDDAHGLGVIGGGRGSNFVQGVKADIPLQMGTLSKALGAYGGYVCASAAVVELIRNRARTVIYSTGLPPAMAAGALAALDVIEREPDYAALPLAKAKVFARRAGLPEPASPIVPIVLGEAKAALEASRMLADNGFLVVAIRPPTVPVGTARLRLTFTAQHPNDEIERLAELVRTRILAGAALSANSLQ